MTANQQPANPPTDQPKEIFVLDYCSTCSQMTNHYLNGVCAKHSTGACPPTQEDKIMAVTNRYESEYAICAKPWNSTICPYGIEHGKRAKQSHVEMVCLACLEYAMQTD